MKIAVREHLRRRLRRTTRWGRVASTLLAVALICLVPPAGAASNDPGSTAAFQYARSIWRSADGLPESTVQALAETQDGELWIGTTGGLAKFGGMQVATVDSAALQTLGVHSVFCLTLDHDGSLWAGTEGGGLLHLHGDAVKTLGVEAGLTDAFVRSVFEDHTGTLWVGTDNGLFRLDGKRLRRVDGRGTVPVMAVHSITEDRAGGLWVGGSQLVRLAPDGTEKVYTLPGDYSKSRVKRILQTADGEVWVGTVGGLEKLMGDRFEAVPAIRRTVRTLLQTKDGTLWIGTIGDGLWTLRNGALTHVKNPGLLPSDTVLTMLQDTDEQIWIGTQAGMVRLSRTPVSVVPLPHGGDPDFETISGDARGNIWVAAQQLFTIKDGEAQKATLPGLPPLSIRNVFRERDGALWIGTDGSGAYRTDARGVRHLSAPGELTNNFIRAFLQAKDGAVWIATDEGVSRWSGGDAQKYTEGNGLVYFSTRSLLEDRDGGIWIGTDRGVSLWRGGAFQQNAATVSLAHDKVWSMLKDREGTLWFATRDSGLFRFRDGHVDHYTTTQGLPSNSLYALLQDREGTFWVTGPDMIASLPEEAMDAPFTAAQMLPNVKVYTMPFGADDAQMYGGRQPAGFVGPDDTLWFPTTSGAASIRPGQSLPPYRAPRAVIREIREDGRAIALKPDGRVPAAVTRISFDFGAVILRPQNGVRFRYRLEPLEQEWNLATADRTAAYTNLSSGHYRFRVEVFDQSKPTKNQEADFSFNKAPFFYQTAWFYTLAVLSAGSLVWLAYRLRVRQMRMRFDLVLAERSRLAREMHDTVLQGCTGISALLEAIASTHNADRGDDLELLNYARQQARTTIDEARQAVWDMRHDEKKVDVLGALQSLADHSSMEVGAVITLETTPGTLLLDTSVAHEILMTVREAVYNALQHSGSARVVIYAEVRGSDLTVEVVDFGSGFKGALGQSVAAGHFGLLGMSERMKRLGARLELKSTLGAGTRVTLQLRHVQSLKVRGARHGLGFKEDNGKLAERH